MKATKTYRRNSSSNNNDDEGDKFGKSRQQLPRRCKDSHPYYGLDIMNDDEDYNPRTNKKKRWLGSSSSTKQAQVMDSKRNNSSSSSVVTAKQKDKEEIKSSTDITILSWLIDMKILKEDSFAFCNFDFDNVLTGLGKIKRQGIECQCCSGMFSILTFSRHGGFWNANPFEVILVGGGNVTMLTCMIEAWNRHSIAARSGYQHVERRFKVHDHYDDCCMICADGGNLICCERCPSTYHFDCIGFEDVPKNAWNCSYCRCKYCDLDDTNHLLLTCFQCSKKSHVHCASFMADQVQMGLQTPFCGIRCWEVYNNFEGKLGKIMPIEYGLSWTIVRRMDLDTAGQNSDENLHMKAICNTMVVLAAKLLNESFDRIVDRQTRSNMIDSVVYNCGSNFTRTNFNRFYTVILEYRGKIVSVASLRMPSPDIAEIPFIATIEKWQNKGMCRLLLRLIESELARIGAKHIIIPSAEDMVESWQEKFGFTPLEDSVKDEISKLNILMFPKTTRLQKEIKKANNEIKAQLDELKRRSEETKLKAENAKLQQRKAKVQNKEPSKVQEKEVPNKKMVLDLNMPPEEQE